MRILNTELFFWVKWGTKAEHDLALDLEDSRKQITMLKCALKGILLDIADYERVNNLAPTMGHKDCWQSVTYAKEVLEKVEE